MTSPMAPMPNETPEQRQARLDAAYRAHAELIGRQRAAEQARMMPTPEPMPMRMPMETPIAQQRPDPDFNINIAMNTFNQRLGELVRSGQMTVAQAQAAQADMRALQLNPAAANRQAATDIAQRHLQVGKYAPAQQPQGGLTLAEQPEIVVTRPMPQGVGPSSPMPTPTDMREVIGQRSPIPGVHGGDTRIFAPTTQPPMALPGGTGYDEQGNMIRPKPDYLLGIGSLLANFGKSMGDTPMQPKFIGQHFTGDAPPPGKKYIETPEGLVPVPINDMPMRPSTGPGLGGGIGAFLGRPGQVSQGAGMPPGMGVLRERIGNMLNPQPRQPSGVDNSTFMAGDPNFRFGQTPQQMAPNAQGMAMGGLMNKYYGGEC